MLLAGSRSRSSHQNAPTPSPDSARDRKAHALSAFGQLPLMFEPNIGQSSSAAKFVARGAGYSLFLGADGAVMNLQARSASKSNRPAESLQMKLAGANQSARIVGVDLLPGKSNYFIGNDPSRWRSNVPQFARVRYESVYPGINLVFYGNQGQLEYDFQVAPGADPALAQLEFNGLKQMRLEDGNLILQGERGSVRLEAPRIYQQIEGRRQPVEGRFALRAANRVGFEIGPYDRSRELVIDPQLSYSTYFGGAGDESSPSIAVDNAKNIYIAGSTTSPDLPVTAGVKQGTLNGAQNIFVLKLNSQGTSVSYVTYLGGTVSDTSVGIAVDGGLNAYVAGTTSSPDFPTTLANAYQALPEAGSAGTSHVFVSVLDSLGATLKYSSYLSGNGTDVASGMTIDNKGNLFVTGTTTSSDVGSTSVQFPASSPPQAQPFQSAPRAPIQFFVTKVNTAAPGTGSIAYSTYFGGANPSDGIAVGGGIAVDSTGNIYFNGTTNFVYTGCDGCQTTDFPILNAYQPCLDTAPPTTIVTPPTCATTTLTATDAFIAKLNPAATPGSQLKWSTYFGGSNDDGGAAIALDTGGASIYITGSTNSADITLPTALTAYQECLDVPPPNPDTGVDCAPPPDPAATDAFVARLNNPSSGVMALTYFSYLGGAGNDVGSAITVDTASGALLTGWTESTDFPFIPNPTSNPLCTPTSPCVIQSALLGPRDAFFARINTTTASGQSDVGQYVTYFGGSGTDRGTGIAIDASLATYLAGDTTSPDLQVAGPFQGSLKGPSDAFILKLGTSADLAISGKLTLSTGQTYISAGSQATFTYTVTNNGPDVATNITVSDSLVSVPVTFNSATATSGSCSSATSTTPVVCTISSLQSGSTATITIVVTPTAGGNFNGGAVTVRSTENDPQPDNNNATVSAQASDFGVDISPKNFTVSAAGATAPYDVQLAPLPFYSTAISLSVSGLPTAASSSFTTSSVTLNGGPASSTLSIATTARPITADAKIGRGPVYAFWLAFPGIALLGIGAGNNRRRRRLAAMLLLCLLCGLILFQPACSSSSSPPAVGGTPAGTYTLTLTATSGTVSHNTTFTLTVP